MFLLYAIPFLYLLCFACLTFYIAQIIRAGAETYNRAYTEETSRQFADIFLFIPPHRISELAWAASVASFLLLFFLTGDFSSTAGTIRGFFFGALAAGLTLNLPRLYLAILKRRRAEQFNEQLVDALMTMSNALRSGSSIIQAFEHIVRQNLPPISQEFNLFLQETRLGVKFEEALANLNTRVNNDDLTIMIRAIEIARQTGGNLTEVFDKISAMIRERMRIQKRVTALTSQGRLQGIVVGIMPVFLLVAMTFLDPKMMLSFFTAPIGIIIAFAALILEIAGALMIRKIINIDI
ncbi:MAG: type II secretion system F family protein [Kiritimatiellia bacterium]|nr:type II secretion system F family protein [Kiritimatiellia bacterium]